MRNLILTALLLIPWLASAEWRLNPYTQRQDYYESKAAVVLSTGALQVEVDALHVATTTLTGDLATEVSRATLRENNLGASTGTLKVQIDAVAVSTGVNAVAIAALKVSTGALQVQADAIAVSTGVNAANISTLSASTVTLAGRISANEAWISTAQPRLDNLDAYSLSTGTVFGGDVSGTYGNLAVIDNSHLHNMTSLQGVLSDTTTVPPSLINLSTVTTALAGKLSNTETVPISLIDLSTVTTALAGKLSLSGGTMTGGLTSESWANFTSSVTASAFYGDGSNLTGISTVGGAGVLQLDDYGNLLPDDIVTLDSFLEVVGNDIIPLEAS